MGKTKKQTHPGIGATSMSAAMAAFNPIGIAGMLQIMNEGARFMTDRFKQDLELQQAMLRCTTPQDLINLQTEFVGHAVQQYTDEAGRLFEMTSKATEQYIAEATASHARAHNDVPV